MIAAINNLKGSYSDEDDNKLIKLSHHSHD